MYKKIYFASFCCLIILTGTGCSNSQPNPAPSPIAVQTEKITTKTYQSEKFGYHFFYPADATISEFAEPKIVSEIKQMGGLSFGSANVSVTIYDRSLEKKLTGEFEPTEMAKYGQFKSLKIGKTEAWQSAGYGTGNYWFIDTVFVGQQFTYLFTYSNPTKDDPADIAEYKSILNSFVSVK